MTEANQKGEFFFSRNLPATTSTALLVVHLIFGVLVWGFFYEQALGRVQICLKVQQIFWNSTEGIAINVARKIPIFFVAKHYVMK